MHEETVLSLNCLSIGFVKAVTAKSENSHDSVFFSMFSEAQKISLQT